MAQQLQIATTYILHEVISVLQCQYHHFHLQIGCLQCVLDHPIYHALDRQVPYLGVVDHQGCPCSPHPLTYLDLHPTADSNLICIHRGAESLPDKIFATD